MKTPKAIAESISDTNETVMVALEEAARQGMLEALREVQRWNNARTAAACLSHSIREEALATAKSADTEKTE